MRRNNRDGTKPDPRQTVFDGLLPVATAGSRVVFRQAAGRLPGTEAAAAAEAPAELDAV